MGTSKNINDGLLNVVDAAKYLGITSRALSLLCSRHRILFIKFGSHNRFTKQYLDEWIKDRERAASLITVEDAAKYLGVAKATLYCKYKSWKVPYVKIDKRNCLGKQLLRFDKKDLDVWMTNKGKKL